MDETKVGVMAACRAGSWDGTLRFPEVVERLQRIGVERYHADFTRDELTYYLSEGASHVEGAHPSPEAIADAFSPDDVQSAIRDSQRGAISYPEFVTRVKRAGCVGYFVQIAGRRALYLGRRGEVHLEPFPGT